MGDSPEQSQQRQEIQIGDAVEIFGLTGAPGFNGQYGRVAAFLEATQRFVVELSLYEDSKAVKAANLRKLTVEENITKRYRFDSETTQEGTFGVGKVYIATDRQARRSTLQRKVTIKKFEITDHAVRGAFAREVEAMKALCHPNICKVLEVYMDERTVWACVMGDEQQGGGRISRFAEKKPGKTEAKHANHVTLYDINNKFVKPWTRNLGNSIALLLNNKRPLKAQVMVSHSWAEDVIEAMVALLGQMFSMGLTLDASIWFCTFAQYQPGDEPGDCGPGVASQLGLDPFRRVIESCPMYGMIVLHTSRAEVYERLWCVYEVNEAINSQVESRAAVSMDYLVEHHLKRTCDGLSSEELSRVSTCQAQCSSKQDAEMIHIRIMQSLGYDNLDKTIGAFRRSAIDRMDEAAISFFNWADEHKPFEGDEQRTVCILRDKARTAGIYVGLHCLLSECRESEHPADEEYLGRVLRLAKMAIGPLGLYMYADGRHPPMFDPTKASVDQLDKLLRNAGAGGEDGSFLLDCLSDLGNFPLPMAYLEMSAGGSSKVEVATAAVAVDENPGGASPRACCVCL